MGAGDDEALGELLAAVRAALAADPPRSRWVQLATVDEAGAARVRTLVLHALDDDATVTFATDAASGKVAHLRACTRSEVCVLSREKLEQFRLLATFSFGDEALRRRVWRELPAKEKGYYVSPPPGLDRAPFAESAFKAEAHGDEPAERFVVLRGVVERCDRLDVSITPHRRFLYEKGARWTKRELSP